MSDPMDRILALRDMMLKEAREWRGYDAINNRVARRLECYASELDVALQSAQASPGVASEDVQADLDAFNIWRAQALETLRMEANNLHVAFCEAIVMAAGCNDRSDVRSCERAGHGAFDAMRKLFAALDRAVALPEEK